MAARSGLGAQLAVAKETTYGTRVTPSRALPIVSEDLAENPEFFRSDALRAGQMARAANLHRRTTRQVEGTINMELLTEGMGWLFDMLHGNTVTPTAVSGSTLAKEQVHEIGLEAPWGKSLSIQVGRPGTGGVVHPFDYLGCKITEVSIECEAGGAVTVAATIDGQQEITDKNLVVATYETDAVPYVFPDVFLLIEGSPVENVRSLTWNISVPQNTERFHLGTSGLKDQPIANELVEITAEAVMEFNTMTDHNRFKDETEVELQAAMSGPEIESGNPYTVLLESPAVKQTSSGPAVEGPDVITASATFEILANGTDAPLTATLINTDTAVV